MFLHIPYLLLLLFLFLFSGCDSSSSTQNNINREAAKGEFINRRHDEFLFTPPEPTPQSLPVYPWTAKINQKIPLINKNHFRCKGNSINPIKKIERNSEVLYISDCNGPIEHSLPIKQGKEQIYPILIDLLNYLQSNSGRQVIVTSGHRCPNHHQYIDNSSTQRYSKHMIGAEVDFYLAGLEDNPEIGIAILQDYFQQMPFYTNLKDYQQFARWEKGDQDTSTAPWYNKEIFIKLYKKHEGRNLDNSHTHPYISVQVRYDKDLQEKVIYSWDKAFKGYHRH